jgi:hypothetical protein
VNRENEDGFDDSKRREHVEICGERVEAGFLPDEQKVEHHSQI